MIMASEVCNKHSVSHAWIPSGFAIALLMWQLPRRNVPKS